MFTYLPEFLTIATLHLLAAMSPGPDFALVLRNSIVASRKAGIYSALGTAAGIVIHVAYSLLGIGFLISQSIVLFTLIKYLGALYLIYIGIQCLKNKTATNTETTQEPITLTAWQAFRMGFLTNVLNPKVTLFFLSLFTQVIHQTTPLWMQLIYGLEMVSMTFIWFASVALILSNNRIKQRFSKAQHLFEKVFGTLLIALGIKIALSNTR